MLLLPLSLTCCRSSTSVESATTVAPPSPQVAAAIAALRHDLDASQNDGATELAAEPATADYLLTLSREQVSAALGAPQTCAAVDVRATDDRGRPLSPCESEADWHYAFHPLTRASGPELLIHFDEAGRCVRVGWRRLQ